LRIPPDGAKIRSAHLARVSSPPRPGNPRLIPLPANLIVRWRWPIVALWLALAVVIVPVAGQVHERLQVGGQNMPGSESTRAENLVREQFANDFTAFAVVVVKSDSLTLDSPRFASYVDSITVALQRLPFVLKTLTWQSAVS